MAEIELTILMPCLNEAETLGKCITDAKKFLDEHSVSGEILIADNASTDSSAEIAESLGARVVSVSEKGYGNVLIGGISEAKGKYIIMGDCDMSYDFTALEPFLLKLREGYSLVMGNRFAGGIEKGAMPLLHRLGVPFLSFLGRVRYRTGVRDFHCGLRGFSRADAMALGLKCGGMEFATEIIGRFALGGYRITEVPTVLRKDGRSGKSHLRSIRDGFRHLRLILGKLK